jgi:hypothetical protein
MDFALVWRDLRAQIGVIAIARVEQHHAARQAAEQAKQICPRAISDLF